MSAPQFPVDVKFDIPSLNAVGEKLQKAIDDFLCQEAKLFAAKAGEKAMTASLADYLREAFAPWDIS